jgi:RNA polymerase sigma factor (sigma-70 family)
MNWIRSNDGIVVRVDRADEATKGPAAPLALSVGPAACPPESPLSFEQLYELRYGQLVRFVTALTGGAALAEDVAQEAFARYYVRIQTHGVVEEPWAYLRMTAINLVRGVSRRSSVASRKAPLLRTEAPPVSDPLLDAIDRLPYRQRTAIVLRFYERCSEAEIAEALGCRPGTVKSLLHRGTAALRKVIEP